MPDSMPDVLEVLAERKRKEGKGSMGVREGGKRERDVCDA